MAKSGAVWGIDIGGCALKSLRCRPHDKDPDRIVAESFDYIEFPKILSQPEADRGELIRDAIEQFVARNDTRDDIVAISVPGQMGLARFIKLPPVEAKKIPDIVKYEARQQIPFALEDVVWDYQQLAGGNEEEGFALETEVGLFAMKRDQVARALEPLEHAGIDVDIIQLAPLAIYNSICFDRLEGLSEKFDPQQPPPSIVVIALGTDTTDLVVTNGHRVWQRNIPIGGNHFTKALSKELKLTFTKAEHLKRHATEADDPKAVFQAMRPIFSDLLAEIQRSIGYFTSIDKTAKIGEIVAMGNALKLPGLKRYLEQNLDHKVTAMDQFEKLAGGSVTAGPQFKENVLSFSVCYGLCLQGLGKSQLRTNLLPEEIITRRLIAAKKPWVVAAAAALLVGCTVNFVSSYSQWKSADLSQPAFVDAMRQSGTIKTQSSRLTSDWTTEKTKFNDVALLGKNLVSNVEGRLLWLEMIKAVGAAMPKDPRPAAERKETAEDISRREELHIESVDCEYFPELGVWYGPVEKAHQADLTMAEEPEPGKEGPAQDATADAEPAPAPAAGGIGDPTGGGFDSIGPSGGFADSMAGSFSADGPTGPGYVIQLVGHHFHNGDKENEGAAFVYRTLMTSLEDGTVSLPDGPNGELIDVLISELGVSHPVLVDYRRIEPVTLNLDVEDTGDGQLTGAFNRMGGEGYGDAPVRRTEDAENGEQPNVDAYGNPIPRTVELRRFWFIVQFAWKQTPRTQRLENRRQKEAEVDESVFLNDSSERIAVRSGATVQE